MAGDRVAVVSRTGIAGTGGGMTAVASLVPSIGATAIRSVEEYEYKPSGRATVKKAAPASTRLAEAT